jgi:3D (Asp-Asp-Asp) domain-containing protein
MQGRISPRSGLLLLLGTLLAFPAHVSDARARPRHAVKARHRHRRVVKSVRVTGYCMGPCRRCGTRGRTYTGTRTLRGIAVARHGRRVLPIGAEVFVPGYGSARIDDVGGGVGPTQIDLRFKSHRTAARWGTRKIQVIALVLNS